MRAFLQPVNIWENKKSATLSKAWTCTSCRHENTSIYMVKCARCGAPSTPSIPKSPSVSSSVIKTIECPTCTLLNPSNHARCEACGSPLLGMNDNTKPTIKNSIKSTNSPDDRNDEVIINPEDAVGRKRRNLYGSNIQEGGESGNEPRKKLNLFETLSSIQRNKERQNAESPVLPQYHAPRLISGTNKPLSTLAAMRSVVSSGQNPPTLSVDYNSDNAQQNPSAKSRSIPMSARKLKEQNGVLSSISSSGNKISQKPPSFTATVTDEYDYDYDFHSNYDYYPDDSDALIVDKEVDNGLKSNFASAPTKAQAPTVSSLHNRGQVIELDLDDDEEEKNIVSGQTFRNTTQNINIQRSNIASILQVPTVKGKSRLETLSDDESSVVQVSNRHKQPTQSKPSIALKAGAKSKPQAKSPSNRNQKYERLDQEEERSQSEDDSDYGSLEDFIVDNSDIEEDDNSDEENGITISGSDAYSQTNSEDFLDSDENDELNDLYAQYDGKKPKAGKGSYEEIIISDDDKQYNRRKSSSTYRHGRREEMIIDDDGDDDLDDHSHRQTPVFDLTAGFVQHTRNDLKANPPRNEFRELSPTFPNVSSHYWSVKQVSKEGCCAIDFNLFTLDAGATNPNAIGAHKSSKSTSKVPLSLEESYAKRRAAKEAKAEKKRRATAAKAAKRKRASSSRRKARATRAERDGEGDESDERASYAKTKAKGKAYFAKAKYFRKK